MRNEHKRYTFSVDKKSIYKKNDKFLFAFWLIYE